MAESDWVDDPGEGDWEDDSVTKNIGSPSHGAAETAVMHGVHGATSGFLDEISGAGEAAGRMAGVKGLGGSFADVGLSDEGPTLDWETLRDAYRNARDKKRKVLDESAKENPGSATTGNIIGAVASPINRVAKGMSLAKGGAALGGIGALGNSESEDLTGMAKDTMIGAGLGAGIGKAVGAGAPLVQKVGNKLGVTAEKLAVNSTGATGKQASEFADGAGRQLLDRRLVRFGDSPENIANRVGQAKDVAAANIDEALSSLDAQGVTASADNIVAVLRQRIDELKLDPSQAGLTRKLEGIVDDITNTGRASVPISAAEQTKRGFNKMAGNWIDPEAGQAGKQAYLAYMDEVERAAGADPKLKALFEEGKKTFGLLSPIEEAASKRAMTQSQSPWGGLGDMAAAGTGALGGGLPGAVVGVVGKKVIAPRLTSSAAFGADKISKLLAKSPQMAALAQRNPQAFNAIVQKMEQKISPTKAAENSKPYEKDDLIQKSQGTKYAKVIQDAAGRGDQALGAANFVLQQTDPEYRRLIVGGEE